MRLIDSHSHLFLEEFAEDLPQVMARAREAGVGKVFLPAIDIKSPEAILDVCRQYPGYAYPMVGLHPEEVRADWREVLAQMMPYISVFPAGTVNLVAKELLLKADPHKWFKRVSKGIEVPVYMGRANGNVFLTVAGIGFDSLVVDKVTEKEKKLLNKLAYVWQGTEIMRKEFLFNNWRYRFQVRFDDEEQWYDATSVIVGKSRYYAGRYNLFNGASLSSPLLHAALFTGDKRGDFIRYAACIAMEALTLDNDIIIRAAKKMEIRCNEENFAAELDGDAVTTAPLLIEMESEPIKFLA